ncbi:MAG: hypothetical protein M3Q39_13910, partial [Actinomycetota bacterium]|nr:hypothetical protein [Actinomycetota bacterium]
HEQILDLPDVVDVATLAEHAKGALIPEPPQAVTFQPDASGDIQPTNYWIGDTIRLVVDRAALQIDMTARILAVEIEVDAEGNETHTLEIGERRAAPLIDMLRGLARAQRALARHETPQA